MLPWPRVKLLMLGLQLGGAAIIKAETAVTLLATAMAVTKEARDLCNSTAKNV